MTERLRGLIEKGKQALDKEIVVQDDTVGMVDEHTGLEDDGSRDWEDDGAAASTSSAPHLPPSSFRNPYRRPAPPSTAPSSYTFSAPISRSLSRQGSTYSLKSRGRTLSRMPSTLSLNQAQGVAIRASAPSTTVDRNKYWQHPTARTVEDDFCSGSPELRKFMEDARKAKYEKSP